MTGLAWALRREDIRSYSRCLACGVCCGEWTDLPTAEDVALTTCWNCGAKAGEGHVVWFSPSPNYDSMRWYWENESRTYGQYDRIKESAWSA